MLEKQSITWTIEDENGEGGIDQIKSRVSSWQKKSIDFIYSCQRDLVKYYVARDNLVGVQLYGCCSIGGQGKIKARRQGR